MKLSMSFFRLFIYRLTMSNTELLQCQRDRRSMDEIRRTLSECAKRIRLHEDAGGYCGENGGVGVQTSILGHPVAVYRKQSSSKRDPNDLSSAKVVNIATARYEKLMQQHRAN